MGLTMTVAGLPMRDIRAGVSWLDVRTQHPEGNWVLLKEVTPASTPGLALKGCRNSPATGSYFFLVCVKSSAKTAS